MPNVELATQICWRRFSSSAVESVLVALLVLVACSRIALAQVDYAPFSNNDTGVMSHGLYAGDHENINPFSGNLNLQIPLVHLPGRAGDGLSLNLSYNSNFWYARSTPAGTQIKTDQAGGAYDLRQMGWNLGVPYLAAASFVPMNNVPIGQVNSIVCNTYYTIAFPNGSKGFFDQNIRVGCQIWDQGKNTYVDYPSENKLTATSVRTTDPIFFDAGANVATARDGTQFSYASRGNYPVIIDRNGNQISGGNGLLTDNLGRQLTYGCLTGSCTIQYPDETVAGGKASIVLGLTSKDLSALTLSSFPCASVYGGLTAPNAGVVSLIGSIQFPDGTQYSFTYNGYGELASVQYPQGGYTRYIYDNVCYPSPGIDPTNALGRRVVKKYTCRDAQSNPVTPSCPSGEDETDYALTFQNGGINSTQTINEKDGSTSKVLTTLVNSGTSCHITITDVPLSKVLKTIDKTYSGAPIMPCSNDPTGLATTTVTLDDNTTSRKTTYQYTDPFEYGPNIISEYDFTGTLVRQTKKTFWANTIHVLGIPTDIQTLDGAGSLVAETSYTYDEYSTYPLISRTGATQHDDTNFGTGTCSSSEGRRYG